MILTIFNTDYTFQIINDYKGKFSSVDTLKIKFGGGILTGITAKDFEYNMFKDKFPEITYDSYDKYYEDPHIYMPFLKDNDTLIMFIKQDENSKQYRLVSQLQGHFKIIDGKTHPFTFINEEDLINYNTEITLIENEIIKALK